MLKLQKGFTVVELAVVAIIGSGACLILGVVGHFVVKNW